MKEKKYIIYKHTSPSGKIYIGQTCAKPSKRFGKNGSGYKGCTYFKKAIDKYGWDNFSHIIIASDLTKKEADWLEIYLISYYNSKNPDKGYNLANGGKTCAGVKRSEEFKRNLSELNKGKVLTEEHKRKISESNKGKKLTENQRKFLSEVNKGRKLSAEHIEKLRYISKTRTRTKEELNKIGLAHKGKQLSIEHRHKLSESHKGQKPWNSKQVLCIETGESFCSAREAGKQKGLNGNNINFCCRGFRHTCGEFHWKYVAQPTE